VWKLDRATVLLTEGKPKEAEALFKEVRDHYDALDGKDTGEVAEVVRGGCHRISASRKRQRPVYWKTPVADASGSPMPKSGGTPRDGVSGCQGAAV